MMDVMNCRTWLIARWRRWESDRVRWKTDGALNNYAIDVGAYIKRKQGCEGFGFGGSRREAGAARNKEQWAAALGAMKCSKARRSATKCDDV